MNISDDFKKIDETHFLYFIVVNGYLKIGITNNIKGRIRNISGNLLSDIIDVFFIRFSNRDHSSIEEYKLFELLKVYHKKGEWFYYTLDTSYNIFWDYIILNGYYYKLEYLTKDIINKYNNIKPNNHRKISNEKIKELYNRMLNGEKPKDLLSETNISYSNMIDIKNGKRRFY